MLLEVNKYLVSFSIIGMKKQCSNSALIKKYILFRNIQFKYKYIIYTKMYLT